MISGKTIILAVLLQVAALPFLDTRELHAGNVGVDVNIHLGNQLRPVILPQPPPVVVAEPVYEPEPYYEVEEEVEFIYPRELGFYVAVGVPYDLFYLNNAYFIFRDGRWLRSGSSRGGWVNVTYRDLPPTLRRHRMERIREYRTREYVIYQRDRDHYRGRHRSDKGYWKAARHEEKRFEKEQRRDERRYEKHERRDERRHEKHERREDKHHERGHRGRD